MNDAFCLASWKRGRWEIFLYFLAGQDDIGAAIMFVTEDSHMRKQGSLRFSWAKEKSLPFSVEGGGFNLKKFHVPEPVSDFIRAVVSTEVSIHDEKHELTRMKFLAGGVLLRKLMDDPLVSKDSFNK